MEALSHLTTNYWFVGDLCIGDSGAGDWGEGCTIGKGRMFAQLTLWAATVRTTGPTSPSFPSLNVRKVLSQQPDDGWPKHRKLK